MIVFCLDLKVKNVNNTMLMVNNTVEKFEANFIKSKSFSGKVIKGFKIEKLNSDYFEAINGGMPLQSGGQGTV
jgi:hypothetical protein